MSQNSNSIPETLPPLPGKVNWSRSLPNNAPLQWLGKGWSDMMFSPISSFAYGFLVFFVSVGLVFALYYFHIDQLLLPLVAGFMVIGPILAVGLYNKSRLIVANSEVTLGATLPSLSEAGGQIAFVGVLLTLLAALWIRAAVLIYALFFGLKPFTGLESQFGMLFTSSTGMMLLLVGSLVGGLFAAFAFAISVFSIPMLLEERVDAFTAMGTSVALVWGNLSVMIVWGSIVLALFLICVITGFLGLVLIFPLLGHATWHAYKAIRH